MSVSLLSCVCMEEEEEEVLCSPVRSKGESSTTATASVAARSVMSSSSSDSPQQQKNEERHVHRQEKPKKKFKDKVLIFTGALGSRDQCEDEDWDISDDDEDSSEDGFEYHSDSLFDSEKKQINWKWPTDYQPLESFLQDSSKVDMITEVQRRIGVSSKNYMKLAKKTNFPLDKCTIVRYLEAHLWVIDAVAENIMETIEWRVSFGIPGFDRALVRNELETGKFFCRGKSRDGRPLVYLLLGRENTWSPEGNTAAVVYTIERAISAMSNQAQEAVYIIDCKDVGFTTAPSSSFVGQLIGILGKHYPRRLGQIFICNVSSVFYFVWNVISLTLKEMTVKKIQILTSDVEEMKARIGECIAPEQLHTDYGGDADFTFDVDAYLQSDRGLLKR